MWEMLLVSSLGSSGFIWLLNWKCRRAFTDEMDWGTYCGLVQGNNTCAAQLVFANHSIRWSGGTAKHGVSQWAGGSCWRKLDIVYSMQERALAEFFSCTRGFFPGGMGLNQPRWWAWGSARESSSQVEELLVWFSVAEIKGEDETWEGWAEKHVFAVNWWRHLSSQPVQMSRTHHSPWKGHAQRTKIKGHILDCWGPKVLGKTHIEKVI